ncbi:MAG: hypothetical protein ACI90V_003660, partial [Bacillariaceae sp.]|jgi:hypothetical protein
VDENETLDEIVLNIGLDGRRRMAKSEGCVVFHRIISDDDGVGMSGRYRIDKIHSFTLFLRYSKHVENISGVLLAYIPLMAATKRSALSLSVASTASFKKTKQ